MIPGRTAIGTWSGGRFMHFGEELDDERLEALLRPGHGIRTVLTADVYGEGEADRLLGRSLAGVDRDSYALVGAIGHDFHLGERQGAKGFPRFTDPALRGPDHYAAYLRRAAERSLDAIGVSRFDVLLLHNPDRTGYESAEVWAGMAALRDAGLTDEIGIAPGPANGFTLDLIACLERFGDADRLGDDHPEPARALAGRAGPGRRRGQGGARDHPRGRLRRAVLGRPRAADSDWASTTIAASGRRAGSSAGFERIERMQPVRAETGLTPMQLACQWNLAHPAVECVAADPDPGGGPGGAAGRGQAPRAGRPAARPAASSATRSPRSPRSATTAGRCG